MKTKLIYTFCFLAFILTAQKQDFLLEKANCVLFKKHIYAYGFKGNSFLIYKLKPNLQLLDSVAYVLEKGKNAEYLSIDCDTTHETLNFKLQKKDKQNVTFLRFDTNIKLVSEFKNVEVTKLDPFATFDHQKFIFKQFVYAVKTAIDSTGKQYYLSKYHLQTSNNKAFDYKFIWQFNFEKKHIENVKVFYADTMKVLAYVHVNDGIRKGQWVLKINAINGLIIKAKKINANSNLNYRYGNHYVDTISKNIFLLGQITDKGQLASATPTLFVLMLDSMHTLVSQGNVTERIALANPKAKTANGLVFQIGKVEKRMPDNYEFQIDFYKKGNADEFVYCNSSIQKFALEDEVIVTEPVLIKEFPELENYFFTTDKKDLNGKIYPDTTISTDRLFYNRPVFKVNQSFKFNSEEFPVWVLKKIDNKNEIVNYSTLRPGNKIYELSSINNIKKGENPGILFFGKSDYVLFNSVGGTSLHLECGNW